jgi:DNA-binding transcriptional LysR family regulator
MRLEQLQCLIRIAEVGSLREAARREGLTQPALSKMIASLEQEIGAPLLVRSARGATLTNAGVATLTRARVICTEARKIAEDAAQLRDGEGLRVKVGLTAAAAHTLLPPVLAKFREMVPNGRLEIVDSTFGSIYGDLRNKGLDFAICPLSTGSSGRDLDATALFSSPMTPVCACDHKSRDAESLDELMGEMWTWAEDGDGGVVSDAFRANNLPKPFSIACDSFSGRLQLIVACNAIGLFPLVLLENPLLKGHVCPIHVRERIPEVRYYLFRSANSPLTRHAEVLAGLFKEQADVVRATNGAAVAR